jgi:hypothetical protein
MPNTRTPEVRIKKMKKLPELNTDEFYALTDLLYEALSGNVKGCAELLGISRATWKKWEKEPPTWPWWNIVLRLAIKHTLTGMIGRRRSPARKHKQHIREALARIPDNNELIEAIEIGAYDYSSTETWLRKALLRGPRPFDELRVEANVSPRVLRTAAKSLGIVKEQIGYGENKRSLWSLPSVE